MVMRWLEGGQVVVREPVPPPPPPTPNCPTWTPPPTDPPRTPAPPIESPPLGGLRPTVSWGAPKENFLRNRKDEKSSTLSMHVSFLLQQ